MEDEIGEILKEQESTDQYLVDALSAKVKELDEIKHKMAEKDRLLEEKNKQIEENEKLKQEVADLKNTIECTQQSSSIQSSFLLSRTECLNSLGLDASIDRIFGINPYEYLRVVTNAYERSMITYNRELIEKQMTPDGKAIGDELVETIKFIVDMNNKGLDKLDIKTITDFPAMANRLEKARVQLFDWINMDGLHGKKNESFANLVLHYADAEIKKTYKQRTQIFKEGEPSVIDASLKEISEEDTEDETAETADETTSEAVLVSKEEEEKPEGFVEKTIAGVVDNLTGKKKKK